MDFKTQLNGLNQFLTAIYGKETRLSILLDSLGFETAQIQLLREKHLEAVVEGFIEVVRKRLTWEEKDLWFRILVRRFGLDGEPASAIEAVASALSIDPSYAAHAEGKALQECRYKTALQDFKKELHRIALHELSRHGERPAKEHVTDKLNHLANLRAAVDLTRMDYETKRKVILQKVQAELDALEEEYTPLIERAEGNASLLEAEIKNDVLLRGESVRNEQYQAIYSKGRISWDSNGIGEYARSHPEILKFRKEGQPTVSLRLSNKSHRD
ncbi:MAG: hypothetical protein AB1649_14760 [Chloroflexota bacterium]